MVKSFVKTEDLIRLCYDKLIPQISNYDIDGVVGIPRSGMIVGSAISTVIHTPLYTANEDGIRLLSARSRWGGARIKGFQKKGGVFLVIDDTVWKGREMARIKKILKRHHPDIKFIFAAIYVTENLKDSVDFYCNIISSADPPYWEWHFMGHPIIRKAIFDLDGLLCKDAPLFIREDPDKYIDFISNVPSSHYSPHAMRCHSILTGRSEKYREPTEKWLEEKGILYKKLYMYPEGGGRLSLSDLCDYKANFFGRSDAKLLIESHCGIAECINNKTGKCTLCLPEGIIFNSREPEEGYLKMNDKKTIYDSGIKYVTSPEDEFTECQCESAGYCPVFQQQMGKHLHRKCQRSEAFRKQYLSISKLMHDRSPADKKRDEERAERRAAANKVDEAIKELKQQGIKLKEGPSEGLGDTIEKTLSKFGITTKLIEKVSGMKGCRCEERKKWLNKIFPYKKK